MFGVFFYMTSNLQTKVFILLSSNCVMELSEKYVIIFKRVMTIMKKEAI
jgi:hypothetical protein